MRFRSWGWICAGRLGKIAEYLEKLKSQCKASGFWTLVCHSNLPRAKPFTQNEAPVAPTSRVGHTLRPPERPGTRPYTRRAASEAGGGPGGIQWLSALACATVMKRQPLQCRF